MTLIKLFETREPSRSRQTGENDLPDSEERKGYLTLIVGTLMEHYVYTHDADTKSEIERLRGEIAAINRSHDSSR